MGKLFIDDFIREKGFESTEDYIENCLEENRCPQFESVEYYKSMYSAGLIKEGFFIRTSDNGLIDRTYCVDKDGNLVGYASGPYPGEDGTFKPEEILTGKRISDGWTIENPIRFGVLFREWNCENKQ